jgi:hypothetical protein
MAFEFGRVSGVATPAYEMFHLMFETVDAMSGFWQPSCKGIGRWHMELAHLSAKQGQAQIELGRRLMRCTSPFDVMSETMNYWQQVSEQFGLAGQNMASAAVKATQPPAALTHAFEVLPLPVKKVRDTLQMPDFDEPELPFERWVA